MNAVPTPPSSMMVVPPMHTSGERIPKEVQKPKKPHVLREHLTHRPLLDNHELAALKDKLEFAPRGGHHQDKGGKR